MRTIDSVIFTEVGFYPSSADLAVNSLLNMYLHALRLAAFPPLIVKWPVMTTLSLLSPKPIDSPIGELYHYNIRRYKIL